jgi:DnaJ-class molecular chaperone
MEKKLYVCPCCSGHGVVHDMHDGGNRLSECLECESSGRVTQRHRDELLQWQGRCRLRPLAPKRAESGHP